MNEKKAAFIICVNDEGEFSECKYYLDRLNVPEGFETDIICVREADSMAAGYNAAMESTDAKYKVYLHQDTFIWRSSFLEDMITVFQEHKEVGIMGVVGVAAPITRGDIISLYDTGKVFHNLVPAFLDYDSVNGNQSVDDKIQAYVNALDGLILMTQYDVSWREDLFDGWDFYDASQCLEFIRAGYKAAVVKQEQPWVIHDCSASKFKKYDNYQEKYREEYFPDIACNEEDFKVAVNEFESVVDRAKEVLEGYIATGKREDVYRFFGDETHCGYIRFRELELISRIDAEEHDKGIKQTVWMEDADSYEDVLNRLHILKFAVWRIWLGVDDTGEAEEVLKDFSEIATEVVRQTYVHTFKK